MCFSLMLVGLLMLTFSMPQHSFAQQVQTEQVQAVDNTATAGAELKQQKVEATTVSTLKENPELPPEGSSFWTYFMWFVGIIGVSNIVRFILRFIPTTINADWFGKIIQIINILLGAWIPNRDIEGGVHKRNYSA